MWRCQLIRLGPAEGLSDQALRQPPWTISNSCHAVEMVPTNADFWEVDPLRAKKPGGLQGSRLGRRKVEQQEGKDLLSDGRQGLDRFGGHGRPTSQGR